MVIDPLVQFTGYLLRRVSVADIGELGRDLKLLRLRPAESIVLQIVEANPNITQATVGRMVAIAAPNMVTLISKLAKRGLIERQPRDGRTHGLHLTSDGLSLVRKAKKVHAAHEAAFLVRIPAAHRRSFLAALRLLWNGSADDGKRASRR